VIAQDVLVVGTRPSRALLNTDQTPAAFWITNPTQYITGCAAAGFSNYGFWCVLQLLAHTRHCRNTRPYPPPLRVQVPWGVQRDGWHGGRGPGCGDPAQHAAAGHL